MTQPPHPLDRPFQDVDANAARQYALTAPIESTDTLLHLLEQAFLAGCVRYSHPTSSAPLSYPPERVPPGSHTPYIPTHEDGIPLYPVYHRNGEMRCQKVAFYHRGPVNPTQRADLTRLRIHPSMRIPTPHDVPRCGSCGIVVDPYSTQDLDWAALITGPVSAPPLSAPLPAAEPGADSLSDFTPEGRTPEGDVADPDVQPSAQQQHGDARPHLIQLPLPTAGATPPNPPEFRAQIDHLHALATSLFEERPGHPRGPE